MPKSRRTVLLNNQTPREAALLKAVFDAWNPQSPDQLFTDRKNRVKSFLPELAAALDALEDPLPVHNCTTCGKPADNHPYRHPITTNHLRK